MSCKRFAPAAAALVLLALAGCTPYKMAEVEGTVTMNGKPLDKIQVEFWPEGKGPRSIGVTDANGRYTLMSDDGKKKGGVVGSNKVVLRDIGVLGDTFLGRAGEDVDMTKGKKPRIPDSYGDPHKTRLTKEVASGKCVIDLEVTP